MKMRSSKLMLVGAGAALMAAANFGGPAAAQQPQQTPRNFNWELRDGKRVPRDAAARVTKPDGSWREEQHQGNCVTVKERSAAGEYKETRQCNPQG